MSQPLICLALKKWGAYMFDDPTPLREKIVGRLTGGRQLNSAEQAELDTLAVALDMNENDPMWGQIAWVWAVTPRKEWIDVAHRALAAEIRSDIKEVVGQGNSLGGLPAHDDGKLDAIKASIEALSSRPAPAAPTSQDAVAIHKAVLAALDAKKGVVSVDDLLRVIKDVAREVISWTNAGIAAVLVGLCLFVGYQFGGYVQSGKDTVAIQKLERQVDDLTAALPKSH